MLEVSGSGTTKKEAKANASSKLLNILAGKDTNYGLETPQDARQEAASSLQSAASSDPQQVSVILVVFPDDKSRPNQFGLDFKSVLVNKAMKPDRFIVKRTH